MNVNNCYIVRFLVSINSVKMLKQKWSSMKVNTHRCAFAAASAVSLLYIAFSVLMLFIPNQLYELIMRIHYIVPGVLPKQFEVTWTYAVQGLIFHFLFVYALVGLVVVIYNMYDND